ncbi:IucA/IucC family protein [Kitasatospora sp. McL0602]|uniref:IucA/IucC family protein n=1 Tax=Kitasatospora sp. McL0602 TaxID=3439530 RepID=UPI003F8C04AB
MTPAVDSFVAHLRPDTWATANRLLVRKALAEFAHERLLTPELLASPPAGDHYAVRSDDGTVEYRFTARLLSLDHWQIAADSITRLRGDEQLPLDAVDFCIEMRETLGLSEQVLPVYLEEISSTLAGSAYKIDKPGLTAAELAGADFQAVETGMTEGHPGFVANNGRIGFGGDEYHRYAPEAAHPLRLVWLAARRTHSTFSSCTDIDYQGLIDQELSAAEQARFAAVLTGLGLDPADYHLFPVHPWQWSNKLSVTFAGELAQQRLVLLGEGDDAYLAQQSIRTFFNTSDPSKHYVKTAISVLNMGFMRGLSAAYMEATPAINDWLARLIAGDALLRGTGLTIIREHAAIGYRHRQYEAATDRYSPYRKMLAALWRESPVPSLAPGERLATMASLLHTDRAGDSLAAALIEQSGLAPAVWLRRYLDAYLTPLLHSFYAYDLAFMPHGENVILVLDATGTVRRAIFKDIAEEIVVMDPHAVLPPEVQRVRADIPDHMKLLSIFTDVFDCFFRYLAATLDEAGALPEEDFWRTVAECVADYRDRVPQLAEKFERFDPFAAQFPLSCLNRLQLRDNRQMVDLADPAAALQLVGELANPIAPYASHAQVCT